MSSLGLPEDSSSLLPLSSYLEKTAGGKKEKEDKMAGVTEGSIAGEKEGNKAGEKEGHMTGGKEGHIYFHLSSLNVNPITPDVQGHASTSPYSIDHTQKLGHQTDKTKQHTTTTNSKQHPTTTTSTTAASTDEDIAADITTTPLLPAVQEESVWRGSTRPHEHIPEESYTVPGKEGLRVKLLIMKEMKKLLFVDMSGLHCRYWCKKLWFFGIFFTDAQGFMTTYFIANTLDICLN